MTGQIAPVGPALSTEPPLRFPLTPAQARFWFFDQQDPGDPALNVAVRWEISGQIRDDSVEAAFQGIIARHEALRTRIVELDGVPAQEVMPAAEFKLEVVDIRAIPAEAQAARLESIAAETAERRFDLRRAPLIRATLARLSRERAILLIVAHHAVFDGFSIRVLGEEFGALAEAAETGGTAALPELALQYGDFALWKRDYLASDALAVDATYWRKQLSGASYFEVPADFQRPRPRTTACRHVFVDLDPAFGARLEAEARRLGVSGFAYGAAAVSAALHGATGAPEVLMATQIAGRDEVDLERLIGVFIDNLVLRLPTAPDTPFAAHAAAAGDVVRDALLHKGVPFERLVELLNPPRDATRHPIVSVNFNFQRTTFLGNRRHGSFELISRPSFSAGTIYDLNILLIGRPDAWRLMLDYNAGLFAPATARALLDGIVASFERALSEPSARLGDMPSPRRRSTAPSAPTAEPAARVSGLVPGATKAALAEIWATVLNRAPEDCDGDFFALGGHSMLAVRMLARTRERFGVSVGLAGFLSDPTLQGVAERIDAALSPAAAAPGDAAGATWELMILRDDAPDAPVAVTINHPLLWHGFSGVARAFGVANLRIPDSGAVARQSTCDFGAIVAEAAAAVRARFSGRRLVLIGLCVNGRIALGVAQALRDAGEDVALVGMIDSWAPSAWVKRSWLWRQRARWSLRSRRWGHHVARRLRGEIGSLEMLHRLGFGNAALRRLGVLPAMADEEALVGTVTEHLMACTRSHVFPPYRGQAVLFATDESLPAAGEAVFGWDGVLREDVPVHRLRGWHEDALFRDGLAKLARIVALRTGAGDSDGDPLAR